MSSALFPFAFRPDKKIDREFVRVLQRMAMYARTLTRCPRGKLSESIHKTRVLIKRLRALLWFVNRTLPSAELTWAKSELRKASRLLAPQRDLTVLQSTLKKLSRDSSNPGDRKILARISSSRPRSSSQQAIDEKSIQSQRQATALLLGTIERIKRIAKNCSKWPSPSKRLAKAFRTAKKAGKKALRSGKAIQFHDWRKKTKRLLYQLQLTQPAPDHHMTLIIEQIDKLQNKLGDYHDSAVVQDHLRKNPPETMPQPLLNRSVKLLKKRKKHLQRKAQKLARRIKPKLAP
jgi:CHAD domain-containing protein